MIPFNEEQQRLLNNLTQYYDAWLGHARRLRAEFTYRLQWKTVAGREYLYKIVDRKGNGASLGAKSAANEAEFSRYPAAREQVRAGERAAKSKLAVAGSLYRALRLPVIANPAAAILREADLRGMLDGTLLVIGANALAAYELEAGARFTAGLDATEDFDLSWLGDGADTLSLQGAAGHGVFDLLKAADDTYTVNTKRNFQARNRDAYSVELLSSPGAASRLAPGEKLLPLSLPSQSWLSAGKPVSQVVCARDSTFARIIAPDLRVFALQSSGYRNRKAGTAPNAARIRPKAKFCSRQLRTTCRITGWIRFLCGGCLMSCASIFRERVRRRQVESPAMRITWRWGLLLSYYTTMHSILPGLHKAQYLENQRG